MSNIQDHIRDAERISEIAERNQDNMDGFLKELDVFFRDICKEMVEKGLAEKVQKSREMHHHSKNL